MEYNLGLQERLLAQHKSHYHRAVTMLRLLNAACELPLQLQTECCKVVRHWGCLFLTQESGEVPLEASSCRKPPIPMTLHPHRTLASAVVCLSNCKYASSSLLLRLINTQNPSCKGV